MCVLPVPLFPKSKRFSLRGQELASGQLQDQGLVQRGNRQELETVQALDHRELRLADAAFDGAAIAVQQFQLGQAQQITRIINLLGGESGTALPDTRPAPAETQEEYRYLR